MSKKIIFPVAESKGLDSPLAEHFGRAPYFLLVEVDEAGEIISHRLVSNTGEHFGGRGHAHDTILEQKPDYIVVYGMGPRGLASMKDSGVTVLKATASCASDLLQAFREGRLEVLSEGCHQARRCH
ncbi:MAG: NifB/NifX family molybdenum-iron cluster-binding protein [Candidatus Saccharicenans sp.]|uniref:NifB/NifX family molybdenum-iron cluster-binding protein n=1 Tax=Candidatus Saccharicenans sp. TaxID=2819258 RepID=UPI0040494728